MLLPALSRGASVAVSDRIEFIHHAFETTLEFITTKFGVKY